MTLTHLSLFSGIGGLDLAAEMAGFVTVGQCEWADYPTKVLEKHWPDVPRWRDIRTLTGEDFHERTGLRTVDIISGGFPCQPFSVAGKQKGRDDDRYLWPEMLRVIRELAPRWVVGENVPGILRLAAREVVEDLEREGYNVAVFDFEAAAVGAPHRRERVAFVANYNNTRRRTSKCSADGYIEKEKFKWQELPQFEFGGHGKVVAHAESVGLQGLRSGWQLQRGAFSGERLPERSGSIRDAERAGLEERDGKGMGQSEEHPEPEQTDRQNLRGGGINRRTQWAVEPNVGRVAHGIPDRVDRLKCLGNAVVPQQFYPIFKAIYEVEEAQT